MEKVGEGANQQTSDDIDALIKSAGIEGEATEIREDLAELYVKAENLAMDEDARKGKALTKQGTESRSAQHHRNSYSDHKVAACSILRVPITSIITHLNCVKVKRS